VTLPALMREGRVSAQHSERARALLAAVGWRRRWTSARESSRAACSSAWRSARALALQPALVLADEPTGNLDRASSDEVFTLLRRMHAELNTSFIVVTHDPRLAARCDRVIELVDGRIERDEAVSAAAAQ